MRQATSKKGEIKREVKVEDEKAVGFNPDYMEVSPDQIGMDIVDDKTIITISPVKRWDTIPELDIPSNILDGTPETPEHYMVLRKQQHELSEESKNNEANRTLKYYLIDIIKLILYGVLIVYILDFFLTLSNIEPISEKIVNAAQLILTTILGYIFGKDKH